MRAYLEIEMPKDGCTNCPLARRGSIFSRICVITEEYVDGNYERGGFPTECPLQELQPHGRLVDEENICGMLRPLIENPYCYNRMQIISDTLAYCLQIISDAPTVIPASGRAQEVET